MVMIDGLIRIQNAHQVGSKSVLICGSKLMLNILDILRREGYIHGYIVRGCYIKVYLKRREYKLKFVFYSKLRSKSFVKFLDLRKMYKRRRRLIVVSTSQGVFSVKEILEGGMVLGGKLLFDVELLNC